MEGHCAIIDVIDKAISASPPKPWSISANGRSIGGELRGPSSSDEKEGGARVCRVVATVWTSVGRSECGYDSVFANRSHLGCGFKLSRFSHSCKDSVSDHEPFLRVEVMFGENETRALRFAAFAASCDEDWTWVSPYRRADNATEIHGT